ncbi:hypothetical protein PMI17_03043 [Pantoea sp. GM01]|nr:hypothetical protein PMI17_03043 [Pantoea sp. GM01]
MTISNKIILLYLNQLAKLTGIINAANARFLSIYFVISRAFLSFPDVYSVKDKGIMIACVISLPVPVND